MLSRSLRKGASILLIPAGIAIVFLLAVPVGQILTTIFVDQIAVESANLFATTVLTGGLLYVYYRIASAERNQSDQMRKQLEVMEDQLASSHKPQIAADGGVIDGAGAKFTLNNLGNGPATGIRFEASLEVRDQPEITIEVIRTESQWQTKKKNYLETGNDGTFSYGVYVVVRRGNDEIYRGDVTDVAETLENEGVINLHWRTTIFYDTLLDQSVEAMLPEIAVKVSDLKEANQHL